MNNYNRNNSITEFVDQIFNKSVSEVVKKDFISTKPNVNIIKTEQQYLIRIAAPGLNKEDFKIDLDNNKITISVDHIIKEEDSPNYTRREYNFDNFKRSFIIPSTIDKKLINAKYKLGILEVSLSNMDKADHDQVSIDIQ